VKILPSWSRETSEEAMNPVYGPVSASQAYSAVQRCFMLKKTLA